MTPEVDIAATLTDGRDVTEALRRIGALSLVLYQYYSVASVKQPTEHCATWDLSSGKCAT